MIADRDLAKWTPERHHDSLREPREPFSDIEAGGNVSQTDTKIDVFWGSIIIYQFDVFSRLNTTLKHLFEAFHK